MPDQSFEFGALRDLLTEAGDIGVLAANEKTFLSAYNAFRAGDRRTFQADLAQLKLVPECRRVCEWIRSKECIFLCFELCGPPSADAKPPDVHVFTEAVVRVTSNPKLVEELAAIVEKRDAAAFKKFAEEQKITPFCHFFCHWVCLIRWRLVCRWICDPKLETQPSLATELTAAGHALGVLFRHRATFDAVLAAANAGDAPKANAAIGSIGLLPFCRLICEFFCSWHCVLVCFTLCRQFPLTAIKNEPLEAFAFAQATQALGKQPLQLEKLSAAVGAGDVKAFTALVTELKLQRFCVQLCHWICSIRCRRFCFLVCPPPDTTPLFTHVGIYQIPTVSLAGDFAADGTTKVGHLAFTETIGLEGVMPDGQAAQPYEYRFLVNENAPAAGAPLPAQGTEVAATDIGQLEYWYYNNATSTWHNDGTAVIGVHTTYSDLSIEQPSPALPLIVPRNVAVGPDGWIPVPRMNDYTQGGIGRFVPGGGLAGTDALANLDTTQYTNETINLGAMQGGDSIPAGDLSPRPTYTIAFEARVVGTTALVASNSLPMIALCNAHYTYIRHPEWDGGPTPAPGTLDVCSLDILELRTATGCTKLSTTVTALYTCYHPYLGSIEMWLQGPGIVGSPPPPGPFYFAPALPAYGPNEVEVASGLAGHAFNISGLASCAYILHLRTSPNLTVGDGNIGYVDEDLIAFCTQNPGN